MTARCELCNPGGFGPWRMPDGKPEWCSRHWCEALRTYFGDVILDVIYRTDSAVPHHPVVDNKDYLGDS